MSHFVVYVLVNSVKDRKDAENKVSNLIEKYSENLEVEPYDRECGCKNWIAVRDADYEASKVFGKNYIQQKREEYWNMPEGDRPLWEDHIKEYSDLQDKMEKQHDLYMKPDPECEECNGTGIEQTTYNPNSKWDWWEIGGRWTGVLTGYDPNKDPDNIKTCWLCNGTGIRNDDIVQGECNGCQGKGKSIVWPTEFKNHDGDIIRVDQIDFSDDKKIPYAIVTPDGDWHQKGDMGWWGISSNENPEWKDVARDILRKNSDKTIVVVDCHI